MHVFQVRLDSDAKKIIKRIKKQAEEGSAADADGDGATHACTRTHSAKHRTRPGSALLSRQPGCISTAGVL
jgi:hypothetical protein